MGNHEDPAAVGVRKTSKFGRALRSMGYPKTLRGRLLQLPREKAWRAPAPHPEPTEPHAEHLRQVRCPDGYVSCALDRSPKGVAFLCRDPYVTAMEGTFSHDPHFSALIESEAGETGGSSGGRVRRAPVPSGDGATGAARGWHPRGPPRHGVSQPEGEGLFG